MKYLGLVFRNLIRNILRTLLTGFGTMILVFVVTLVWSVLAFLDQATQARSEKIKAVVTERWTIPSRMPYAYANLLKDGAAREPGEVKPIDYMSWTFYGGTTDAKGQDPTKFLFAIGMEPEKIPTMLDDLDQGSLSAADFALLLEGVEKLKKTRNGILLGKDRLKAQEKKIGDRIKITSVNYRGIDLEFEIVGTFPPGRYDSSAIYRIDYFNAAMEAYPQTHAGAAHPSAGRTLNLVWLMVPDSAAFNKVADQITRSPNFSNPSVKVETSSSSIAVFLEAYRDLLWGARWILSPSILLTLSLIISNAIAISVRERESEFAVMKVLGFRPNQLLVLVILEALIVGVTAGFISSGGTYFLVNKVAGGIPFPIAFFSKFLIPQGALWWGPVVGGVAALAGSLAPALSARSVKVANVFSKVNG